MRNVLLFVTLIFLVGCSSGDAEYSIAEKEYNDQGGKSTVRIVMEDPSEEDIEEIVQDLYSEEFFGSASVHAYIHEPGEDDYGALLAMAKYARAEEGKAQVGVDELDTVYVEFE